MSRHVMAGARIVETAVDGFAARTLVSPQGTLEATFVTGAGMVGSSLRHEGADLLDPRGGVARYAAHGGTMGLPLLHPWANRLEGFRYAAAGREVALSATSGVLHLDENGLPIHGLLPGRSRWEVTGAEATPSAARLATRMVFSPDPALLEAFPFPHEVHLDVTLRDDALVVGTTLSATGDVAVPVSFGFHPYLRLPGVPREQWMVDLPVRQRLVLDQRQLPTGAREAVRIDPAPLADRTFDDAFLAPDGAPFTLAGGGRRIAVEFSRGYPVAQVFTPPKAAFICFEPMTAPANALVRGGPDLRMVEPGQRFTAEFAIRVARA
jgi:aldose 1-epimerase